MAEATVEYHADSRSSGVNIVCHKNGICHTEREERQKRNAPAKGKMPVWFERASKRWWDLRMDCKVLEEQFRISSSPQVKNMFCHSLAFMLISCIAWIVYFAAVQQVVPGWLHGIVWSMILLIAGLVFLLLTRRNKLFQRFSMHITIFFLILLAATGLTAAYFVTDVVTTVGTCFLAAEVILLIYLILPLPFPITFAVAVIFSIAFESLLHVSLSKTNSIVGNLIASIISHTLLHICLHLIGCQIHIYLQTLRHSTFWKICQVIQTTQAKHKEESFKDMMIKSVMPLQIAERLLLRNTQEATEDKDEVAKPFRPFTMEKMENVSILYADIVGFTQMSANKTAAELVGLLNDLFGRFDRLCETTGCEKISTLGDCYYCVAGCPEPRPDHAKCCVEMGLGMVAEIKEFCKENNINVNMRVGIHTGYVLCGIVGTKRFKFDVWSNDVSLANGMEQHGIPGRIHISNATLECLNDEYIVEDSKLEERDATFMEKTGKTFLIVERKTDTSASVNNIKKNGSGGENALSQKIDNNNISAAAAEGMNNANRSDANHFKRCAKVANDVQTNSPKLEEVHNSPPNSLKKDQLMEYLGQHISPFLAPGPLQRLKREEDRKFINSIKDDSLMVTLYQNNEVNGLSLQFKKSYVEEKFRNSCEEDTKNDVTIETSISSRSRLFWDIILSTLITLLIFVSSMLMVEPRLSNPAWIIVFAIFFTLLVAASTLAGLYMFHKTDLSGRILSFTSALSTWTSRHVVGSVLLLIPACVVFSMMQPVVNTSPCSEYLLIFCVALVHFLNYNQLMSWLRSCLAAVAAVIMLVLVYANTCPNKQISAVRYEYILDALLLIVFIWLVNRHFELNYRLDFYCENQVKLTDAGMKKEQVQVEELLHNFIPPHVREVLKSKHPYSKTHKKVGVIFGTIVNFNELYEETYAGGMEFIRYLSELISDVDDLLNEEKYKDIEKIKTIGTTMMLASGLNPSTDQESTGRESHLCRLMDFCMEMQDAVDRFNNDMMNFRLVLRIGFNHGEVTAGVIGSTKRLFDIWGDTVNTASRMDSTGVPGRVQVSEESKKVLEDHFNFKFEAEKFVKGKGQMRTYLLVRDDEAKRKIIPNPVADYQPF